MQDLYLISGIIIALLAVQLFLRYRMKKHKEERGNKKFGK